MRPPAAHSASQRRQDGLALYRASRRIGLSAIEPRSAALIAILTGAIGLGGCGLARNDGPFAKMTGSNLTTGSIRSTSDRLPTDSDLAFARNAASDVLTKGDKDTSQPWANPETGARGSVTPLAEAYAEDGRSCRDFLASYVNGKTESWLQGAACRSKHGRWEVRSWKQWRPS